MLSYKKLVGKLDYNIDQLTDNYGNRDLKKKLVTILLESFRNIKITYQQQM